MVIGMVCFVEVVLLAEAKTKEMVTTSVVHVYGLGLIFHVTLKLCKSILCHVK
jgi:hypothetical protein